MSVFAHMGGCYRFSTALPSLPCHVVKGAHLRVMLNTVEENNIPPESDSHLLLFRTAPMLI